MQKTFDPISSPGGKRDLVVDLTNALETAEVLSTVDVSTLSATSLGITNVMKNASEITLDGKTIAANKGVVFSVETLVEMNGVKLRIDVDYVGDSGSADSYQFLLPVDANLTNERNYKNESYPHDHN